MNNDNLLNLYLHDQMSGWLRSLLSWCMQSDENDICGITVSK